MDDDIKLAIAVIFGPILIIAATILLIVYDSEDVSRVIMCCVAGAFAVIGVLMLQGKGSWFVAGYNTLSPEEKQKYDHKKIARGGGIIMIGCAVFMALIPHGWIMMLIGASVFILSMVTGTLYMRKARTRQIPTGRQKQATRTRSFPSSSL